MTAQPTTTVESIPTPPSSQTPADQRTSFDESTAESASAENSITRARFDEAYQARPPWDIDSPQPEFARLLDQGLIRGLVLDVGCGTGENALCFAAGGLEVTGLDASSMAIARAQTKANQRGLSVRFIHGDALRLADLSDTFDTITDSGLLHVFCDEEMQQVIRGVHTVLCPGGRYWLMCFNEHATAPGPRRLTKDRIRELFQDGWQIHRIKAARFELIPGPFTDFDTHTTDAWLAEIERV
jgi:SAM-dependent methyltransferase